jgi:hypothetical protein
MMLGMERVRRRRWGLVGLALFVFVLALLPFFIQRHHGFFEPILSQDGKRVYFLERRSLGLVWGFGVDLVTAPARVLLIGDSIKLMARDVEGGGERMLCEWSRTPFSLRVVQEYRGSIFGILHASMLCDEDGSVRYHFGFHAPLGWDRDEALAIEGRWAEGEAACPGGSGTAGGRSRPQLHPRSTSSMK